jgi:hypothetical protein
VTDRQTCRALASSAWERESAEWEAVGFHVDESDFAPEILPEEISEAFEMITEPVTIRRMTARLSTGVDGWVVEE